MEQEKEIILSKNEKRDLEIKELVNKADACIIYTGAGMGVDSNLLVFRGDEGLWNKYPDAKDLNFSFEDLANPNNYLKYPEVVVPFYLDRLSSYQNAEPHSGYYELFGFVENLPNKYFTVTSNVDGLFEKANFDKSRILEEHGSIHTWQCSNYKCSHSNKENGLVDISKKDTSNYELLTCSFCSSLLRPNICMFFDLEWYDYIYGNQRKNYEVFKNRLQELRNKNVLIIEIGAGTKIRTIRAESEAAAYDLRTKLIRINPERTEEDLDYDDILFVEMGAADGISHVLSFLEKKD